MESLKVTQNMCASDMAVIRSALLMKENFSFSNNDEFAPERDSELLLASSSSHFSVHMKTCFNIQDEKMLKILKQLHLEDRETSIVGILSITADENRLSGYFCFDIIFKLSNMVLFDRKFLEKYLDFLLIQRKMNGHN